MYTHDFVCVRTADFLSRLQRGVVALRWWPLRSECELRRIMGCAGRCWWCWWPWRCAGSLVLVKPTAGGRLFEKSRRRDVAPTRARVKAEADQCAAHLLSGPGGFLRGTGRNIAGSYPYDSWPTSGIKFPGIFPSNRSRSRIQKPPIPILENCRSRPSKTGLIKRCFKKCHILKCNLKSGL